MKIKDQVKCELARREFFSYCTLLHKEFYKKDRDFLKQLCDKLQEFYYNDDEFMLVNMPPRHGKSFTATNFVEWILGINPLERVMSASYSHDLSKNFSKKVRDSISTEKLGENIVYSDVFPNTSLKFGSSEVMKWQTSSSKQINYLATSPGGSATGFGCTFLLVDDLIKNAKEANNERVLEEQWDWFTNTMLSRREGKKKVLIIMTRWNSRDLAGKILEFVKANNILYSHINFRAEIDDTKMLCEDIFDRSDVKKARLAMGEDIYSANYNQEPIDLKGCLYGEFLTYENLPEDIVAIENYTDTADTGEDSLSGIDYAVDSKGNAYILDILFTQESMEYTEVKLAEMLTRDRVNYARIESNNGGRGFSRNVKRIAQEQYSNSITKFKPFHQSNNKLSRILTGVTGVMQRIYFPVGYKQKFEAFYKEISRFQRQGKNAHDDAADALTGVYEVLEKRYIKSNGVKKTNWKGWG